MDKHISSQFDAELTGVSSRVLELGGLVESQTRHAVYALAQFSSEVADQVVTTEKQVNALEVEIDAELASIIARRQPTARDLRLLMAISQITGNLEFFLENPQRLAGVDGRSAFALGSGISRQCFFELGGDADVIDH